MSSHCWEKEKDSTNPRLLGGGSHRNTGTRVEKGVPTGQQKTTAEGKKTLGSSFEATSRALVNINMKLKKNGMPLTTQAAGHALRTKNGTTQKMITIRRALKFQEA
ncbi:hypothetical protein Tco_0822837 [Tanacetum coccineum]|uniref:Uncharacterized protein n=1 Tax=Tanacetum coccineum TaxID=301880 RepID=A0ABQ5AKI3_9ASTR